MTTRAERAQKENFPEPHCIISNESGRVNDKGLVEHQPLPGDAICFPSCLNSQIALIGGISEGSLDIDEKTRLTEVKGFFHNVT